MAIEIKNTVDHIHTASVPASDLRLRDLVLKAGFFVWHYFEMMLFMGIGATLFEWMVPLLPTSTRNALALDPGTFVYVSGISVAMMFVMVAWMIVRGHGWRHSAEMSVAMLVPVVWVAVISSQKGGAAWFDDTYCSAMCVGMLVAMLFRWDHFTRWSFRSTHSGH